MKQGGFHGLSSVRRTKVFAVGLVVGLLVVRGLLTALAYNGTVAKSQTV
jgi:hypothetical protein